MSTVSYEAPKKSLLERGLKWDEHFNRRLGAVAAVVCGGLAVAGFPVAAAWTGAFAAGNFAVAEVEQRAGHSLAKRRLGTAALQSA